LKTTFLHCRIQSTASTAKCVKRICSLWSVASFSFQSMPGAPPVGRGKFCWESRGRREWIQEQCEQCWSYKSVSFVDKREKLSAVHGRASKTVGQKSRVSNDSKLLEGRSVYLRKMQLCVASSVWRSSFEGAVEESLLVCQSQKTCRDSSRSFLS